ncbi:MAG: ERCC4 domain-containing protein [Ruminococcus sp.]|nr:ERCC4 domain-containing protein [Ruminococcus sp.]
MTIQIDSREKQKAIRQIVSYFDEMNIKHYTSKLFVGDYMNLDNPRVIIDRKQNLQEICGNVCQQHERFKAELKRAQENGIKIIILCEHGGNIKSLTDIRSWVNPRLRTSPKAVSGKQLFKILFTIQQKYNVDFVFCDKRMTGYEIVRLLS